VWRLSYLGVMQRASEQSPVINSPFRALERHFLLKDGGSPIGVIRKGWR